MGCSCTSVGEVRDCVARDYERHGRARQHSKHLLRRRRRTRCRNLDAVWCRAASNHVVRERHQTSKDLDRVYVRIGCCRHRCRCQPTNGVVGDVHRSYRRTRCDVQTHNERCTRRQARQRTIARHAAYCVGSCCANVGTATGKVDANQATRGRAQANPSNRIALDVVPTIAKRYANSVKCSRNSGRHRVRPRPVGRTKTNDVSRNGVVVAAVHQDTGVGVGCCISPRRRLEDSVVRNRPLRVAIVGVGRHQDTATYGGSAEEVVDGVVRDDVAGVHLRGGRRPNGRNPICGERLARNVADNAIVDRVVVVTCRRSRGAEEHNAARRGRAEAPDSNVFNRVPGRTIDKSNRSARR